MARHDNNQHIPPLIVSVERSKMRHGWAADASLEAQLWLIRLADCWVSYANVYITVGQEISSLYKR